MNQSTIKVILGVMMLLGLLASMSSCSSTTNSYRVRALETNTISIARVTIPHASGQAKLHSTPYCIGDTVWVNLNTNRFDAGDSTAMKCIIEDIIK